jgi:hypothetical protein
MNMSVPSPESNLSQSIDEQRQPSIWWDIALMHLGATTLAKRTTLEEQIVVRTKFQKIV